MFHNVFIAFGALLLRCVWVCTTLLFIRTHRLLLPSNSLIQIMFVYLFKWFYLFVSLPPNTFHQSFGIIENYSRADLIIYYDLVWESSQIYLLLIALCSIRRYPQGGAAPLLFTTAKSKRYWLLISWISSYRLLLTLDLSSMINTLACESKASQCAFLKGSGAFLGDRLSTV